MENTTAATVPVKLTLSTLSGLKRRSRLNVPLKFSQLRQQVRSTFPDVKNFTLQYVDEEGDNITVTCDEDLEEAHNVFKDLRRVLMFTVECVPSSTTAVPPPPPSEKTPHTKPTGRRRGHGCCRGRHPLVKVMEFPGLKFPFPGNLKSLFANGTVPALHFGITCDGSNQHPLLGKRYHKIGQNYDLNETEFVKLKAHEQKKYEVIAFPGAVPVPVNNHILKELKSRPVLHHGVTCDGSNQHPLVGVRYHKIGHNYDLNEAEFLKLTPSEQKKYEIISRPGATPVPVNNTPDCVFVRDITIPDGQVFPPGKRFRKTWLVKTGVAGWPAGCILTHICGNKMGLTKGIALDAQKPHALVEISLDFIAPSHPGEVTSNWRVTDPDGKVFGHTLWSKIVVKPLASSVAASTSSAASVSSVETAHASRPAASAPTTPVSTATTPTPGTALQQLLEMGFALPVETLQSVLAANPGNLRAAVATLLHYCK